MSYRVILSAQARTDLESIFAFIAQDNPKNAARFIDRILIKIETLSAFPTRGTLVYKNKILHPNTRYFFVGNYRIIFMMSFIFFSQSSPRR